MTASELTTLSAEAVLAITRDSPELLFAADSDTAERQRRQLSSHWHPDRNDHPQAQWVFSHIQKLYRAAEEKRSAGIWDEPGILSFATTDDRHFRLRYCHRHELELGNAYIGRTTMAYVIDSEYADLASHAWQLIGALPFADGTMRKQMARFLPAAKTFLQTGQTSVIVLEKSECFVALRDLVRYRGGSLAPKHVAWMVSELLNLVCYLDAVGLAHQAIAIDHLLVAPEKHALALTGGWWFAGPQNSPLIALPARSVRLAPPDVLHRQLTDVRLDQFLLRATALELLGDEIEQTPEPMLRFLQMPPASSALEDYERWQQVLWDSFGERRFTPFSTTVDDIYAMAS